MSSMKNIIKIQAKLDWKWGQTRTGNYIAVCDAIKQTVQAGQFTELIDTINEALESTFRELLSTGDLDTFLQENGWQRSDNVPSRSRKNIRFDVPFNLKGKRTRDLQEAFC